MHGDTLVDGAAEVFVHLTVCGSKYRSSYGRVEMDGKPPKALALSWWARNARYGRTMEAPAVWRPLPPFGRT